MKILLDTHILIWVLQNKRDALSSSHQSLLDNQRHEKIVSQISFMELAIKLNIGKLPDFRIPLLLFPQCLRLGTLRFHTKLNEVLQRSSAKFVTASVRNVILHLKSIAKAVTGNTEGALARTDARSDHAVLDLFCFFFPSRELTHEFH